MVKVIYLDANASMPPIQAAIDALAEHALVHANPSSPHQLGRLARSTLDKARSQVAYALGGQEKEVFFTSGASEGNRWLVDALIQSGHNRQKPYRVISSPLEHPSLAKPLAIAHERGLVHLSYALQPEDFAKADCEAVFITAAHNETGIIPDLEAILSRLPPACIVICDASQAMGRLPVLPKRVDAIVASAHKMGAFAGCGAILLRGNARRLNPPWAGGGQESGLRPGTEASVLIQAFGAACSRIEETRAQHARLSIWRDEIESQLLGKWPSAFVAGKAYSRLPNTTAITVKHISGEALRMLIDMAGICVGFGSACSSLAPEPSPSLLALGLSAEEARATVRISLHPDLSDADIQEALNRLLAL